MANGANGAAPGAAPGAAQQPVPLPPNEVFALLGQGVQLFVQTATGIATAVKGVDAQGNLVTQSGQVVPPTTPVIVQPPVAQEEGLLSNPLVVVGLLLVGGLVLATALR